jgi:hypothetical protein
MSDLELLADTMEEWSTTSGDHHMLAAAAIRQLIKLEAALKHTPQPVVDVNQQLLNDIINMMIAVKGAIRLGCYGEAYEYLNAAIAAAQGRNNEPISNLLG